MGDMESDTSTARISSTSTTSAFAAFGAVLARARIRPACNTSKGCRGRDMPIRIGDRRRLERKRPGGTGPFPSQFRDLKPGSAARLEVFRVVERPVADRRHLGGKG